MSVHQPIPMQLDRMEKIIDSLHNSSQSNLGSQHPITKNALKAILFFQALKIDVLAAEKAKETVE
jgi:hypothetical protein